MKFMALYGATCVCVCHFVSSHILTHNTLFLSTKPTKNVSFTYHTLLLTENAKLYSHLLSANSKFHQLHYTSLK